MDGTGEALRVSNHAVETVRFSRDGNELFYSTADEQMYAVALHGAGDAMTASAPHLLFRLETTATMLDFDVSPAGEFVLGRRFKSTDTNPMTVTLNWR